MHPGLPAAWESLSMVFDPKEYDDAKVAYQRALLDAVGEAEKTDPENAMHASLCEEDITERSQLPRPLVERVSDDLSQSGIIECLGGVGPSKGRSYCFTNYGLTRAEKLRFDKSWRGFGRKVETAVKEKAVEGVSSLTSKAIVGIAIYVAGILTGHYGPIIGNWLKGLLGIK
jgi:hypothetical protein